jgi:branched-chain amino acid transport system permease protein
MERSPVQTTRVLYALVVLAVIALPFARNGYALATMVVIGQNALAALGLSLMIGTAGEVVLAQAAFFGLGAYAAAAASRHGIDPWLALVVAALVGAAVAAVVGWPTLRLRGHYLTLATLGLGVIAKVVFDEAGGLTGGPSGIGDFGALHLGAQALKGDLPAYVVAWIAVGLGALGLNALRASARGRALRAIAASETAAAAMGVRVRTRKLEAFVLSAVYGAVAGALYAYYAGYISPTSFTFEQSVFFVVMVVLGGAATTLGPVVGAALFTLVATALTALAGALFPANAQGAAAALQVVAFGAILVAVVRFMPQGIVGALLERFGARAERTLPDGEQPERAR